MRCIVDNEEENSMKRTWKNVLCVGGMILTGCAGVLTAKDVVRDCEPMDWNIREYEDYGDFDMPWDEDHDFDFDFDYEDDYGFGGSHRNMPERDEIEEYFEQFEQQSYVTEKKASGRQDYMVRARVGVNASAVVLLIEEGLIFVALLIWMIASKANKLSWKEVWHPGKKNLPPTPEAEGKPDLPVTQEVNKAPVEEEVKPDLPKTEPETDALIEAEEITVVEEEPGKTEVEEPGKETKEGE